MKNSQKVWYVVMSSRPLSWINTAYPFVAGYIAATHRIDTLVIIGGLYFLIPYNLLMYGINDVFDYESDIRNPRKGGLEGMKLQRSLHPLIIVSAIITNVPFVVYLLWHGSLWSNVVLLFVIFMVIAYSAPRLRFKERPVIDSITSSLHFVGPLLYALTLVGWRGSYIPYVIAFFLWGMASHAFGAVQDITADRRANIASIATAFGAHTTIIVSSLLYGACALLLATTGWAGCIVALVAVLYAHNSLRFWRLSDKNSQQAHAGWQRFLVLNWLSGAVITILLVYTATRT